MNGIEIGASVVTVDERWYAQLDATVRTRLGPELACAHLWNEPRLPGGARRVTASPSFPALDTVWRAISRSRTPVALVCDGRRAVAWVASPMTDKDVTRAALAVIAVATWDAAYAAVLTALPGARLVEDVELSPAVSLTPDGLRVGLRRGQTVARAEDATVPAGAPTGIAGGELRSYQRGVEIVWPGVERDRERLLAAIAALRGLRATGPYR